MSNKSRLQTNNTNLQALIDKANALPDAESGGGSAEVVTGSIVANSPLGVEGTVYYVNGNGVLQQISSVGEISVMKHSLIYVAQGPSGYDVSSGATLVVNFTAVGSIYQVTEDFRVKC